MSSDVENIRRHIAQLDTALDHELPYLMGECKAAIWENEDACALLLPEDIGNLVRAIKRMNAEKLEALTKKAKPKPKQKAKPKLKDMSADELLDALGDL